ncbi:MAG: cupin domain-containing protein [Gammaproteobacteria bacterium]|nr:cupin domain-containing protein [Gammaproteobacteria bacterium]
MSEAKSNILGNITPEEFLATYWQKKSCLIRQAFPDFSCPISVDELAGLACEEDIRSRLVLEKDGDYPWQVINGPFTEGDFKTLPDTHWTLLVQDVNQYVPDVAAILQYFSFIPFWRIDDVMISYSPEQGNVGPHLDSYDVFLLQGMGRRKWQINPDDYSDDDFIPDLDLRIIDHFQSKQDWILEPGDMLYLPPGVAHHGIALDPSLTLSIGFLAPSQSELISNFIDDCLTDSSHTVRYSDPDLKIQKYPGEISRQSLEKIKKMMASALTDTSRIDHWFGKYITHVQTEPEHNNEIKLDLAAFRSCFKKKSTLYRNDHGRRAFIQHNRKLTLFINGDDYPLPKELLFMAKLITEQRQIDFRSIENHPLLNEILVLLCELYNKDNYYFDD